MKRLTTDKEASSMSMTELAHNSCYEKNGWARYRNYNVDIDARDLARYLLKNYAQVDDLPEENEGFEEYLEDLLQYGWGTVEGLIAVFYQNLWAMAVLRERLKYYEDMEEQREHGKKVTIEVECSNLDKLIEKAKRLAELLQEAQQIIDSLQGMEKLES